MKFTMDIKLYSKCKVVTSEASTTAKTVTIVLLLFGKNSYSTVFLTKTPVKFLSDTIIFFGTSLSLKHEI